MARIFYSMAGEGRGHAARVRALTEHLRLRHEVHLFAPGDAHEMLAPLYARSDVRVHRIPGLRFCYGRGERVARLRTAAAAARYLAGLPTLVADLRRRIEAEAPDLVLTDFEPALPRAARAARVPFASLSHQHFLVVSDLSDLPPRLRLHAAMMGALVQRWYGGQEETIVSSFHAPPLVSAHLDALQIGVLLRPELAALEPTPGDHLLAYFRRALPVGALEALAGCGREVRVYAPGLAARDEGRISVRAIGGPQFARDLAGAAAVVSSAGNQLVGEALHLRKPVLAIPEPGNAEQEINAHYLTRTGAGAACAPGVLGARELRAFLDRLEEYRAAAARLEGIDGTARALERVERLLARRRESQAALRLGWSA